MKLYKCDKCNTFYEEDELKIRHTTYESEYGVSDLFYDSHEVNILVCPYCDSEDIEELTGFNLLDFLNCDTMSDNELKYCKKYYEVKSYKQLFEKLVEITDIDEIKDELNEYYERREK